MVIVSFDHLNGTMMSV